MSSQRDSLREIDCFAQLCARLDGGLATRADVLGAAGLDEGGWQRLRASWLPTLAAGDAPAVAQQFSRAYARALAALSSAPPAESCAPATIDAPDTDVDVPRAATDPTEVTLEVPCLPPPPCAVLPFSAPLPLGRRQRLVRFDSQTGAPLATPRWVDDPTPC